MSVRRHAMFSVRVGFSPASRPSQLSYLFFSDTKTNLASYTTWCSFVPSELVQLVEGDTSSRSASERGPTLIIVSRYLDRHCHFVERSGGRWLRYETPGHNYWSTAFASSLPPSLSLSLLLRGGSTTYAACSVFLEDSLHAVGTAT